MEADVREVVCQLAEATRKRHEEEEDVNADLHHDMEHVLTSFSQQHWNMVLFHSTRYDHSYNQHRHSHQQEDVAF